MAMVPKIERDRDPVSHDRPRLGFISPLATGNGADGDGPRRNRSSRR